MLGKQTIHKCWHCLVMMNTFRLRNKSTIAFHMSTRKCLRSTICRLHAGIIAIAWKLLRHAYQVAYCLHYVLVCHLLKQSVKPNVCIKNLYIQIQARIQKFLVGRDGSYRMPSWYLAINNMWMQILVGSCKLMKSRRRSGFAVSVTQCKLINFLVLNN